MKYSIIIFLWGFIFHASSSMAQPGLFNFQGRLLGANGEPVDKLLTVEVRLHESAVSGIPLWQQTVPNVQAINGIYHFNFGDESIAGLLDKPEIWQELVVDGELMTPRQRLVSVPYALWADRLADAGKITGGTLPMERLPTNPSFSGQVLVGSNVVINASGNIASADRIPDLPASKISSGSFDAARIPNLDAAIITSGTLADARVPNLNASKVTAGSFDAARIPNLDAAKITSGTLPVARGGTGASQATGTGKVVLDNSPVFTGNVGIDKASPAHKLDVNGSVLIPDAQSYWIGSGVNSGNRLRMHLSGTNAYIDYATGNLFFRRGDQATSLTLTSGDNVGVGTSTPSQRLEVNGNIRASGAIYAGANGAMYFQGGDDAALWDINESNTIGVFGLQNAGVGAIKLGNTGTKITGNSTGIGIHTESPEQRLDVNGNIRVRDHVRANAYACRRGPGGEFGNLFNIWWTGSSAELWIDSVNMGAFLSDRRLKSDIAPMPDTATERVMALNPVSYKYQNLEGTIFTGSDQVMEGFIADEVQEVIPSAVKGEVNEMTEDGKIQPQQLESLPMIALLTKALQEQQTVIEELKARLSVLESR